MLNINRLIKKIKNSNTLHCNICNVLLFFIKKRNNKYKIYIFFTLSRDIFLLKPYASILLRSYPALGIKSFSKPLSVPTNIISELGSSCFILFAIANAGFICPPVPAAAIIAFIFIILSIV